MMCVRKDDLSRASDSETESIDQHRFATKEPSPAETQQKCPRSSSRTSRGQSPDPQMDLTSCRHVIRVGPVLTSRKYRPSDQEYNEISPMGPDM